MGQRRYPIKSRLAKLSEKTQRYVLRNIISAGWTRAQTSFYRLKRDYLAKRVAEDHKALGISVSERQMRLGFGYGSTNWAHNLAIAENSKDPQLDIKERTGYWYSVSSAFDRGSEPAQLYREAKAQYAKAMEAIETGDYKDMTEDQLQALFYGIGDNIPRREHRGCGRD